jgi:ABC-type Fe3+/spermidine/putrescine transport system ATPase subunit
MVETVVELDAVWKVFENNTVAVRDLSLQVRPGECLSFLGPSGCGKTTTLRMIAGLETPTAGTVRIGGQDMTRVAPKDRQVGMVFQQYALFPHLDVFENLAFGLRVRRMPEAEVKRRVEAALQLVRLPGYERRWPKQLSGGEQQRVALARALITEPKVLLLDEPLGALDRKLREEMQLELKDVLRRVDITALFVTHDQDEALVMSDRVAVMHQGVIEQLDTPEGLYERPRTQFVANFVGVSNLFRGTVKVGPGGACALDTGRLCLELSGPCPPPSERTLAIRPEKARLAPALDGAPNTFPAVVRSVKYFGSKTQYRVELPDGTLAIVDALNAQAGTGYGEGERLAVSFPPEHLRVLDEPAGGERP